VGPVAVELQGEQNGLELRKLYRVAPDAMAAKLREIHD